MNIAFQHTGGADWMAGGTTLEMIFSAIRKSGPGRPRIALAVWDNQPESAVKPFQNLADEILPLPAQAPPEFQLANWLRARGVTVYFSLPTRTATALTIPRILWIYDFQHLHLPEMFPPEEIERRTRLFRANADGAARIMVKTEAIRRDFAAFAPDRLNKVRVIPVAPDIPAVIYETAPSETLRFYPIPDKFFHLPNQFWKHKNHRVILQALDILNRQGAPVTVVCTGNERDPRGADEVAEIRQMRRELGLEACFITLGLVPRDHFFQLMRQSVAVLNPSLFEGFSLSVAEARFLGKPVLAADLPVLREHRHPRIRFFDPRDPKAWAAGLAEAWQHTASGPDRELEKEARQALPAAQTEFARAFLRMAQEAMEIGT